jgi:hypothetical protein
MERMREEVGEVKQLTDEQKAKAAEIDKRFEAEIAQVKMDGESRAAAADPVAAQEILKEMAVQVAELEGRCESEKERLWQE